MVGVLIKKQMMEIFRSYFYNAKKNKKRSTVATILFMLMYAVLMIGLLGGMFAYMSMELCRPFNAVNMNWLYFLIMSMTAIALGSFGSVFNTYSGLYMSKDNDLLLSMPIPVRTILIARLASVYLLGLMYSIVVILPAVIVYWVVAGCTPMNFIGSLLLIIVISLIVLVLSCILGWCVAKISKKLKNKSFVTVLASLAFFAAYYFVYFKAQEVIMNLMTNAAVYGESVKNKAYPAYMFGKIGEGDIPSMLIYAAVTAVVCVLTYRILAGSFISIATSNDTGVKVKYKEKQSKMKNKSAAVLSKEFARFTSSPNYMLNCGLGTLFLIIVGCLFLIKGHSMISLIEQFFEVKENVAVVCATLICMTAATNDMIVPSVSLEGKNLWLIRSLPVKTWDVLKAKLTVQLLVTGIPVIFCDICMVVVLSSNGLDMENMILLFMVPIFYTVFMAVFGLFLGLAFPNLIWTNETAPIKQSLNVVIALFGGWVIAALIAVMFIMKGSNIGLFAYLWLTDAVFGVCSLLLYIWLKKAGTLKFERL